MNPLFCLGSILLCAAAVVLPAPWQELGLAISRVGNLVVESERLGFRSELPETVKLEELSPHASASTQEQNTRPGTAGTPNTESGTLFAQELTSVYHSLQGAGREEVLMYFRATQPNIQELTTKLPCVVALLGPRFGIAAWGPGTGIVVSGDDSPQNQEAIKVLLEELVPMEGACAW